MVKSSVAESDFEIVTVALSDCENVSDMETYCVEDGVCLRVSESLTASEGLVLRDLE